MNGLAWLNPYRWILLVAFLGAIALAGGVLVDRHNERQREIGRGEIRLQWAGDRERALRETLDQAHKNGRETLRRLEKQKENQLAQDAYLARVARDRDALRAERDGLQLRAAGYLDAAGCSALAGDPALECVRAATAKVVDVLGRCSSRLVELAAAADDARGRGLKCEADYDALTPAPGAP